MNNDILKVRKSLLMRAQKARQASLLASRDPVLIAVGKQQPLDRIAAVLQGEQRDFGENRVQEAEEKWPELKKAYPEIVLHLIGPLQSNKAREAVGLFDVIHTVDREKLVDVLAEEMSRQKKSLPCFVQVNTGNEPQKAGVAPEAAAGLIAYARAKLNIIGLMCIPPASENPAPHFALLYKMAREHGLENLSMGMSGDFETAIRFGATHIRVGTALFGERL